MPVLELRLPAARLNDGRRACGPGGKTSGIAPACWRKQPAFTLTAVGVLTLGIGVNAGIFGLINGLMIRPLPGAQTSGELVGLFNHDRTD